MAFRTTGMENAQPPENPVPSRESASTITWSVFPYAFAIFLSAFLLFQVEPIIARYILPWFGGTPAVWTTCMLFFQVSLLGGYLYAHLLASYFSPRYQALIHLSLVVGSLVVLPITPAETWKPDGSENPMLAIVLLLLGTIGAPFLLVSGSGPLLQHWFNRMHPTLSPYRLYALSNFGSLLGLVSYPFVVEPQLGLSTQTVIWSTGYGLYTVFVAWGAIMLYRFAPQKGALERSGSASERTTLGLPERLLTLSLAACGSVVLLASTNQICRDIAVIPFLWVLPLSLYLISFILCFDHPRWYNRRVWVPLLLLSLSAVVYLLLQDYGAVEMNVYLQIAIYSAALFACCMACHGELVRLKPSADHLTDFYLMIALGGALGGVFVNLIAPLIFKGYWEFHGGLVATVILLGLCVFRGRETSQTPFVWWSGRILWMGGIAALIGFLGLHIQEQQKRTVLTKRNFYGVLRVTEVDVGEEFASRYLYHGRITHGEQFLTPELQAYPRAYYGPNSGISLAIRRHPQYYGRIIAEGGVRPQGIHVGNIGLGVGTIATYSRPGDTYRFYEINPDVDWIAREYFTHLKDVKGALQVVLGDGRMSLERELANQNRQQFDVLAVDAFSGDGIPVHLLTREAFALYWEHLRPDGILALHITNYHFDFSPVIRALAQELGKEAVWIKDAGDRQRGNYISDWVLVTSNQTFLKDPFVFTRIRPWPSAKRKEILWTDDYSNLFGVVAP